MPELKDLLTRPVEGVCDWEGIVVKFTANRAAYTHAYERQLRAAVAKAKDEGEDASVHEFYSKALPPLLLQWDLTDGKKLVPLTEDAMLALPLPFLAALAEAIRDSTAPFETKPKSEGSGSFS